jgi:hypothetical protein
MQFTKDFVLEWSLVLLRIVKVLVSNFDAEIGETE